jgi:hypothetical protein
MASGANELEDIVNMVKYTSESAVAGINVL